MREALARRVGAGEADAMVRLIWHHLKGWSASELFMHGGDAVSEYILGKIGEIMGRLEADEPLQYILGEARFYGLDLAVDRNVLIPRPETEELVDMIVKAHPEKDLRVLDLCTGSGAISVALARNLAFAEVEALDVSPGAVDVARRNAKALRVAVTVVQADLFSWMPEEDAWDIMVSNPPYVDESEKDGMEANVLDWEPALALFVPDDDPLKYYRRLLAVAMRGLRPGGMLYLEINPRHASDLAAMLEKGGMTDVTITKDMQGKERFAVATKPKGGES